MKCSRLGCENEISEAALKRGSKYCSRSCAMTSVRDNKYITIDEHMKIVKELQSQLVSNTISVGNSSQTQLVSSLAPIFDLDKLVDTDTISELTNQLQDLQIKYDNLLDKCNNQPSSGPTVSLQEYSEKVVEIKNLKQKLAEIEHNVSKPLPIEIKDGAIIPILKSTVDEEKNRLMFDNKTLKEQLRIQSIEIEQLKNIAGVS